MFLGKYHVVLFQERTGSSRSLRVYGWFGVVLFALFIGLSAGNIWLFREYQHLKGYQQQTFKTEDNLEDQSAQIFALTGNIARLQAELERLQTFDSKMRLMMDVETDTPTTTAMGGAASAENLAALPLHRQGVMLRKLNTYLKQLAEDTRLVEVRQQELLTAMREKQNILASTPSIWPTEGFISSRFGWRKSPFSEKREKHNGLDIVAKVGTPIYAPANGFVALADVNNGYGNNVALNHGGGITTRYAHMEKYVVKKGQRVKRGELIGYVGNTGRSSGPHLHYEVLLNGVHVNPMNYIINN